LVHFLTPHTLFFIESTESLKIFEDKNIITDKFFKINRFIVKQVENNHCDLSIFVGL